MIYEISSIYEFRRNFGEASANQSEERPTSGPVQTAGGNRPSTVRIQPVRPHGCRRDQLLNQDGLSRNRALLLALRFLEALGVGRALASGDLVQCAPLMIAS